MATLPLLAGAPSTDWQELGLCRASDATVFFPPAHFEHKPERTAREAKAKAICARCPVRITCLDWAITTREPHGVWGGYSESERKQILLGKRKAS
jgi:WhiB family redox-sensing transcriptional regulator